MIQQDFYDAADAGYNIFLTGIGGSWKSYALKNWCERQNKKIVVTAPTGIAAINAGWTTIHKAFQVSWDNYIKVNHQDISWDEVDVLIIDEISMVSCELLDYIDKILRTFRTSMLPFGWMQVILVWDLAQLEPVYNLTDENTKKRYDSLIADKWSTYFIVADSYINGKFKQITLTENKRSVDDKLNNLLNKVREWDMSVLSQFKRVAPRQDLSEHVHIFPYNVQVDKMNWDMLTKLSGENKCYYWHIEWNFNENNCISPKYLNLKVWAKIMITKNLDCWLVNWDMWTILSLWDSYIKIFSDRFKTSYEITVATWENKVYDHHGEEEVIGKYMQMPLKLGYAITAHKSQWLTLDKVCFHYSSKLSRNLIYVALSRATTYDWLLITS